MNRDELLRRLNERMRDEFPDKRIVAGEGSAAARAVLIGEAPGEKEELLLRPFVGKAGENLNEFLALSGIERSELYITNTVKFRPVAVGKSGRAVNRKPTRAEIDLFFPYLARELEIIKPECTVTLGNVPLNALLKDKCAIGSVHGKFISTEHGLVYPMYHPASVIYNRSLREVYISEALKLGEWMRRNA